jgi:DeoR family transcriptional regulator, fructose operon transcriptional repressor
MIIAERQSRLRDLLARRGMSDLESLSAELSVSQSTIRRDVELLVRSGHVKRTHGGVIWVGDRSEGNGSRPYAFDQRLAYQLEAKRAIAAAARKLVRTGQTVILDGGTTTFHLAQELLGQPLQLVTNSLPIANLFLNDENVELILVGGLMYPRYGVLLGPMAETELGHIHAQTLFISVAGVLDGALYNQNLLLVQAERRMIEQAQQVVLLVDSGKFGQQALARLGELDEVDVVVSDIALRDQHREQVKQAGCELIIAGE